VRQGPIQRRPVGTGLAAGNDRDWGAGVMEKWSVGVLRFLHSRRLAGLLEKHRKKKLVLPILPAGP
jgi:hypothetical protein